MTSTSEWIVGSLKFTNSEALGVTSSPTGEIYAIAGQCIYEIDETLRYFKIYAGGGRDNLSEGPRRQVTFSSPHGIGLTPRNEPLVACTGCHCVYIISKDQVKRFAGTSKGWKDGPALEAQFDSPQRIVELNGNYYIPDCWNHCVRIISASGMVSTIGTRSTSYLAGSFDICSIPYTRGLGVGRGNTLVVCSSGPHKVSLLDLDEKEMIPIAGNEVKAFEDGPAKIAKFNFPFDVTTAPNGDYYVADDDNHRIRKVSHIDYSVTTLVKDSQTESGIVDGNLSVAATHAPTGICISHDGALLWTERTGHLRYIEDFAPERKIVRDPLAGFEFLLDHDPQYQLLPRSSSGAGAGDQALVEDLHFAATDTTYHIQTSILALWQIPGLQSLASLESFSMPLIHEFLAILHAKLPTQLKERTTTQKIVTYTAYETMAGEINELHVQNWAQSLLAPLLRHASQDVLLSATHELAVQYKVTQPSFARYLLSTQFSSSKNLEAALGSHLAECSAEDADRIMKFLDLSMRHKQNYAILAAKKLKEEQSGALAKVDPLKPLQKSLRGLYKACIASASDTTSYSMFPSVLEPNFNFTLQQQHGKPIVFRVHDWILFPRWTFFKDMLSSGLEEASSRQVELADFLPLAFEYLLEYLYTGRIKRGEEDKTTNEDAEACKFLLDEGARYGLVDFEGEPRPGFKALVRYCTMKVPKP